MFSYNPVHTLSQVLFYAAITMFQDSSIITESKFHGPDNKTFFKDGGGGGGVAGGSVKNFLPIHLYSDHVFSLLGFQYNPLF